MSAKLLSTAVAIGQLSTAARLHSQNPPSLPLLLLLLFSPTLHLSTHPSTCFFHLLFNLLLRLNFDNFLSRAELFTASRVHSHFSPSTVPFLLITTPSLQSKHPTSSFNMKSVTIIALISTVVSLASANFIEKTLLCQEVCWMHDVDNLEACKDRCMRDPRPTEAEAGYCQSCIVRGILRMCSVCADLF